MAGNLVVGIIGGLTVGVLVALFAPWSVVLIMTVALLLVAIIPQFESVRIPALMALLTMVGVTIIKFYGLSAIIGD